MTEKRIKSGSPKSADTLCILGYFEKAAYVTLGLSPLPSSHRQFDHLSEASATGNSRAVM